MTHNDTTTKEANMKAYIVKVDGSREVVEFEKGESYDVLSKAVGGYIECVRLADNLDMWVNEEGKLVGLPVNEYGTLFYQEIHGATDIICGDVIFTGGADDEGETLGLSDDEIAGLGALVL
jgi:hypothetical protein